MLPKKNIPDGLPKNMPENLPNQNKKHSHFLKQKWLKFFMNYNSLERDLFLQNNGIDYNLFYKIIENLYNKNQHDLSNENLDEALKRVRAITKRPRIGKKTKIFC